MKIITTKNFDNLNNIYIFATKESQVIDNN